MTVIPRRQTPAPPLLRPPRRGPRLFLVIPMLLLGIAGGMVLGLAVPQAPRPVLPTEIVARREAPAREAPMPAVTGREAPAVPSLSMAPPAAPPASNRAELTAELGALRQAMANEQARLTNVARARSAAEAQLETLTRATTEAEARLATLQRDVGQARRDAAARASARPDPAPAVAAPASQAPSGAPRVVVHYRAGSGSAAETAGSLTGQLREGGFETPEPRAAPAVPSQRVVRYFHSADAATAARLAGRLGRGWAIQDFRTYEPSPPPQTLEVWLPDR